MKTKTIVLGALVGAAAVSADAGLSFGISVGLPIPVRTVVVTAPPAPIAEVVPACPGTDYVWAPGYWMMRENRYVWIQGAWGYRPSHACAHYEHHRHW